MSVTYLFDISPQRNRVDDQRLVPQAETVCHLGRDARRARLPLRDNRLTFQLGPQRIEPLRRDRLVIDGKPHAAVYQRPDHRTLIPGAVTSDHVPVFGVSVYVSVPSLPAYLKMKLFPC